MLTRVGNANDVADGEMHVYEVGGTKVNVANAGGRLYAFDDTCTHMGCSLANGDLRIESDGFFEVADMPGPGYDREPCAGNRVVELVRDGHR